MVKHIVMFKLKDNALENASALCSVFLGMRGKIDGLIELTAGANYIQEDRNYDVVLECIFENKQRLVEYQTHPVHMPVKAYVKPRVESSVAVDYEFELADL